MDTFDATTGTLEGPKLLTLDVNLKGGLSSVKLAAHFFKKNANCGGRIVLTGSLAAYLAEPVPVYQASKHALLGFMRAIRSSAPMFNVSISMIAPWVTETSMVPPSFIEIMANNKIPVNKAETVARGIAVLSGEGHNGETIVVAEDQCIEVEGAFDKARSSWLGEKIDSDYRTYEQGRWLRMPSGW
ncbi:hypothetical protein BDZ94DRAFT_1246131 [Collybia nuda]|uniref:Uncharacterized protein n=1 Tax=Collybia nuda TaxID=64659 RepID=A0A9P6CJQ2_9AGAR|nr:hypothetical protein BDZ94DRAFT_1246131 [Collybia nuda]